MPAGTYTILIELDRATTIRFGAAGKRDLESGWYAYTGSAFGPGGFSRIDRHRAVAAGENDARHWHVDSLLGHPAASLDGDVRSPGSAIECRVAQAIEGEPISGVGASDCDCVTHLVYSARRGPPLRSVRRAHEGGHS